MKKIADLTGVISCTDPTRPMLHCSSCRADKLREDFGPREHKRRSPVCRRCNTDASTKYVANNRDRVNANRRRWTIENPGWFRKANLKRAYGITPAEWDKMFSDQGCACAICKSKTTRGRGWQTDHDHETGSVRAILCNNCNALLGHAKESIHTLWLARQYLVKFHAIRLITTHGRVS